MEGEGEGRIKDGSRGLIEQLGDGLGIEIQEFCFNPVKFEVTGTRPSKQVQGSTWIYEVGVQH